MKKVMFGLAAAAAISAFAIESANVVGYATPSLGANANLASVPFDMVGDEGMDIQNIKPAGDDIYGGAITLKLLNDDLSDKAEYFFYPAAEAPDGGEDGWWDENVENRVVKTFAPGEGFILVNGLENGKTTYSGQVMVGKPTWEIAPNANLAGNITPIDLDVQDIKVGTGVDSEGNLTDENDEIYGGAISIKLLNDDLSDDVEYFYYPAAEAPDGGENGWWDENVENRVVKTFAPGEGFIVVSGVAAGFVQIPAALTAE